MTTFTRRTIDFSNGQARGLDASAFFAAHGFPLGTLDQPDTRWVFQAALSWGGLVLTVWWLTTAELDAITDAELEAVRGEIVPFCNKTRMARRAPLPQWWQPRFRIA